MRSLPLADSSVYRHSMTHQTLQQLPDLPDGIHHYRLDAGHLAFVKLRRDAPLGFFSAEARGLKTLVEARTLRVPEVFIVDEHGIAIEDLGSGRAQHDDWQHAGQALAAMHSHRETSFGFPADGWCGDSAQDNTRDDDGFRFFAERRLLPQARRARDAGHLERADIARIESICARLHDLLPEAPPSLVHGDLWTGNLHVCASGELALIDAAAAHYGWAEGDLAMLTLFGEPPSAARAHRYSIFTTFSIT